MAKKMEGGTSEDLQKKQEHVPAERVGKILSTIQAARAHYKTIDQSNIGEVLKLVEDDYLQLGAQETAWLQRTLRREHNIDVDIGGDESLLSDIIEQPKAPKREKKEISPEEKWRIRKETIINSLKNTFSDPDQLKTAFSVDEKFKEFRNLTEENITELKEALASEGVHDRKDTTELPPDTIIHGRPPEAPTKEFIGSRAESTENGVFIERTNNDYAVIERFGSGDKKRTKQLKDVKISRELEKDRAEDLTNSLNEIHDGLAERGSLRVSKNGEIRAKYTNKGTKKEIEFKATDIGITDEELNVWNMSKADVDDAVKKDPDNKNQINTLRGKMKDKIRAAAMNKVITEDFKPPKPTEPEAEEKPKTVDPDEFTNNEWFELDGLKNAKRDGWFNSARPHLAKRYGELIEKEARWKAKQAVATQSTQSAPEPLSAPTPDTTPAPVATPDVTASAPVAPEVQPTPPTAAPTVETPPEKPTTAPEPESPKKKPVDPTEPKHTPESLGKLRNELARKELAMQDAERKTHGFFGFLNIEKKGDRYRETREAYEAAKKEYQEASSELNAAKVESRIDELLLLNSERTKTWEKEHSVRAALAKSWNWFSNANAIEGLFGNTDFVKKWQEFNESSTGWAKGARLSGAGKFLVKMALKAVYNLGTARGAISGLLIGFGTAEAFGKDAGALLGIYGSRVGLSVAGGYVAGSSASRGLTEWAINRKDKNIAGSADASLPEKYQATLAQYATLAESLRRGIPNKKVRAAKEVEFKELAKNLVTYGQSLEGGLDGLQEDTFKKTQEAAKKRGEREVWHQGAGILSGLALGAIGASRVESMMSGAGIQYPTVESGMSRGAGAIIEEKNMSAWQPGQEASTQPLASFPPEASYPPAEMSSWEDLAKHQPEAAARLTKALGLKYSIPVHELEKVAKAHHLLDNPADLRAALNAVVSVEIDPENNHYGKALESALTDLAYKAEAGDAVAIGTLKKFFTDVNMGNVDVTDLDQDAIHRAMLKKVNMHGADGEVAQDVKNKVHFKNRLVIASDGKVDVLQAGGKEAADRVPEKAFLQNLARRMGADPNSVSFKNGWGEVGMKLNGHEISIKNPHNFEDYDAIRQNAEEQIAKKTVEAALENQLTKVNWVTFKNPDVYGNLKGIPDFKLFLQDTGNVGGYAVAELTKSEFPELPEDTNVYSIDIRPAVGNAKPTDYIGDRWGVTVKSEVMPNKHLPTELLEPTGKPNEMLKQSIDSAVTVRHNVERLDDSMGLTRDMAIEYTHMMGVPFNTSPGVFGEFVDETREVFNRLGKTWKPLVDGSSWDRTNINIMGALPDYSGEKLQTLLAHGKTMTKLSFDQKIAALDIVGSKSPKALGALLEADKVSTLTNTATSYDATQRILTIKNIEVNGETIKSITIDTSTGNVKVNPSFWSSTKTGKLDSIKKLFVR